MTCLLKMEILHDIPILKHPCPSSVVYRCLFTSMLYGVQNLANILWAYATMDRQPSAEFLAAAESRYVALLPAFNAQGIANSLWAFAQLDYKPSAHSADMTIC